MLKQRVVKYYQSQGYEVIAHPDINQLPFDLNDHGMGYCPDLLVKQTDVQGFVITVKDAAQNLSIERYHQLARAIATQGNWRFLLITGEDATPISEENLADHKLTRSQILKRKERIAKLFAIGEFESAFLSLWIFAEILLRRYARQALIPVDRLPTMLMLHHLHDQEQISTKQFVRTMALSEIRNRVAHGFEIKSPLNDAIERLLSLVDEFITMQKN